MIPQQVVLEVTTQEADVRRQVRRQELTDGWANNGCDRPVQDASSHWIRLPSVARQRRTGDQPMFNEPSSLIHELRVTLGFRAKRQRQQLSVVLLFVSPQFRLVLRHPNGTVAGYRQMPHVTRPPE